MEEGKKQVVFDEFEMLLGEIPNATYGNPSLEESDPYNPTNDFKFMPFDDQTMSPNKFHPSPIKRVHPQEPTLSDIHSLTSKFSELNTIGEVRVEPENPSLVNYTSLPSHQSPLPAIADRSQYSSDIQSAYSSYLHPQQQRNQPHITQRQFEEDHIYRMHLHYMYHLQLCNQRLEAMHPIQANRNSSRHLGRRPMQLCFEMPHQLEQFNQEQRSNNFAPTGFNRYNPAHIPEKILTKSQGLNSFGDVKFGSVGSESPHHVNSPGCYAHDNVSASSKLHAQKYNSLDEVSGRIYVMARDQHECRFLQRKISEGNQNDIERIFIEIIGHIVELMTDPFGNYLVQKLLEVCDENQRTQILVVITRKDVDLVWISCDMHGTRAVQKVVETLRTPEQFSMIVSSLKPGVVTLIKNMNGNHVAQRCLQYLVPEHKEFIFEAATSHCVELGTDRHGCCVLQKGLLHSDGNQRRRLIYDIISNALILSQDPYGNYVVQYIFELQLPWAALDILRQLEGNYGDLSIQKYSSNVVEKCLRYADEGGRFQIIQELMRNPHLDQIMQDPYGNYVIQAALKYSKGALNAALVEAITPHVPLLRTSPYGKKVLSRNKLKK